MSLVFRPFTLRCSGALDSGMAPTVREFVSEQSLGYNDWTPQNGIISPEILPWPDNGARHSIKSRAYVLGKLIHFQ